MTDHKFTDDEIIHSLKVCSNDGDCSECLINPHKGNYGYCTSLAIKAALDLINRQKREIERLEELTAEKQNLIEQWQDKVGELLAEKQIIEAEAINAFAKKIKTDAERICDDNYIEGALIKYVDTLVKEMTETK